MADGSFLGGHVNVLQLTDYSFLVVSDIRYQFSRELDADWHENE